MTVSRILWSVNWWATKRRRVTVLSLMLILVSYGVAVGQEWTRFRGPDGGGIGKGEALPIQVTEADYRWQVRLSGPGHSSPVLWGQRVFTTCTHDEANQREVVCIDADTGKQLWSREFDFEPYRQNSLNSFAASTPAVDESHCYVNWVSGDQFIALALDHDGNVLWQRSMGEFKAVHGAGASPIAWAGLMIVGNDNKETSFLIGLDGKTGKTVWQIDRQSKMTTYSTPTVYRPAAGKPQIVFTSEAYGLTGVDPLTGVVQWESDKLFTLKSVASPVVAGRVIFATAGAGGAGRQSAAVVPGDRASGKSSPVVWQLKRDLPYVPTPIAVGPHLYILSDAGVLTCVKPADGQQVWQENLKAKFYASPVAVNNHIYLVSRDGELIVLRAGPSFHLVARHTLPERSDATPAIANGRLYVRTLNHLICIGP